MNMTKKSKRPMFNKAGIDMTKANRRVRMPRAPFTKRNTRPTRTTLTILNTVGEKLINDLINFSKMIPKFVQNQKLSNSHKAFKIKKNSKFYPTGIEQQ